MTAPPLSLYQSSPPEFVPIVLAATVGTRLFPITSRKETPKHLLPMVGVPNVVRILKCLQSMNFTSIVLVISNQDEVTTSIIEQEWNTAIVVQSSHSSHNPKQQQQKHKAKQLLLDETCTLLIASVENNNYSSSINNEEDISGSAQAIRSIHELVPLSSHMLVLPGDLVILNANVLTNLLQTHRQRTTTASSSLWSSASLPYQNSPLTSGGQPQAACTILLGDVSELDEHGSPLKESAKSKKGGLGRDEEEIEYIALSYDRNDTDDFGVATATKVSFFQGKPPRVIWKQPKLDVEEDKDMVGSSPKFVLPKPRLKSGAVTRIRLDWNDWHVYILSPWVRTLINTRTSLFSLQRDLIPLLVSRQFLGQRSTFGGDFSLTSSSSPPNSSSSKTRVCDDETSYSLLSENIESEFAVLALIDSDASVFRAHTCHSYLHATKQLVAAAISWLTITTSKLQSDDRLFKELHSLGSWQAKTSTVLFTSGIDAKHFKCAVVGKDCVVGSNVRLNNCIVHGNVKIGDNVILQNTIVGTGATIGDNCNLNDCQVASGKSVQAGIKEKGESID